MDMKDYFRTIFENKLMVYVFINNINEIKFFFIIIIKSKMPEREDDHLTPATKLLEKRREMIEVENALAAEKEVKIKFYILNR
jgi:hypothetical protein